MSEVAVHCKCEALAPTYLRGPRREPVQSQLHQGARVNKKRGRLFMATDYEPYARWIADVMAGSPGFENVHAPEAWSGARPARRETAYEAEFLAEGRSIAYFEYRRERAGRCAA